jgi:hypothetical protein
VSSVIAPCRTVVCEGQRRRNGRRGSARFFLLGEPFHGADRPYGLDGLRFAALPGGFCVQAVPLEHVLVDEWRYEGATPAEVLNHLLREDVTFLV